MSDNRFNQILVENEGIKTQCKKCLAPLIRVPDLESFGKWANKDMYWYCKDCNLYYMIQGE